MLILGKCHGQQKNSWLCNSQDELGPIIALFFNSMKCDGSQRNLLTQCVLSTINLASRINFKFLAAWVSYSVNLCVWMMTAFFFIIVIGHKVS